MASLTGTDKKFAPHVAQLKKEVDGKDILVTGGTGSFGKGFIRETLRLTNPKRLIVFSRDELKQSEMMKEFSPKKYPCMRYFLGDVRDKDRLRTAFHGVDIIIHAAALKQVPAIEYNPGEAVKTNILGAMNIIAAAKEQGVSKIIALSTDKAAQPVCLYGATKLASDKLFVASNTARGTTGPIAAVVRYGNVFGSRGSVVPLMHDRRATGKFGITDVRMTRFNLPLIEAVNFVLSNLCIMQGGEIFVPKIPSYKLPLVAEAVLPECEVDIIGIRPGEKLHEVMVPKDEARKTVDIGDRYIIEPEGTGHEDYVRQTNAKLVPEDFEYHSANNTVWNTVEELRAQYLEWVDEVGLQVPESMKKWGSGEVKA